MYNPAKLLLAIATTACFSYSAYTQTDTSATDLDLGRIKLKKDFTQSITIKGEHLEKMPFTSLSEAINAWSYGYYASKGNTVYVVDGIMVNDVNAWSVYDIEEVTIVQNALVQVNGANRQQQLVLVTTHKAGAAKQGFTVAGQSFLVKGDPQSTPFNPSSSTETNFFHQYHVSAYRKEKNIQYGLSANYLRDVNPPVKDPARKYDVPENYDRFRLNAWLNAKLGSAHDLSVRMNLVPQVGDMDNTFSNGIGGGSISTQYTQHNKQTTLNPTITLRSRFLQGFTNEFTASYASSKVKGSGGSRLINSPMGDYYIERKTTGKMQQVLLTDQVSYHASLNDNWHIEASVNFMFRYSKDKFEFSTTEYNNGNISAFNMSTFNLEGRIYLLTPSVNLYYKNSFNIQGGLLVNLSKTYGQKIKKVLPFVTTSIDVLRLTNPGNPTSLKFFGSYAQTNYTGDRTITLADYDINMNTIFGLIPTSGVYPGTIAPDQSYWIWQAGSRFSILNNLLSVNYQFERRDFAAEVFIPSPMGNYTLVYPNITSSAHHVDITATVLNKNSLHWLTGINASSIKSKTKEPLTMYYAHNVTGDLNSDKTSWTGGWVNRFSWKQLSAGIDLVYYFNPDQLPTIPGDSKVDALSLQNVYVGYQLNLKRTKGLELYADCRNLKQDKDFKITGTRKYYGLGFKANL